MMKKKKAHGIQLLIRAVVRDPDGKIITDTGRRPAKSYVIQLLEFLYYMMNEPSTVLYATATDGTEDIFYYSATFVACYSATIHFGGNAGVNVSAFGIVVGTGDTAETNTDYKLDTQLTEGVTAGKITHGAQVIGATAVVGANVDLDLTRAFTNNTGSTITVKEAGMYVRWGPCAYSPFNTYFCTIRDVLAASVDVPDKCSLTIIYTVRTTV